MRSVIVPDYDALSDWAARMVLDAVGEHPEAAVVPATGNTPAGLYARLAGRAAAADFSRLRVFQLDEYVGVAADDRRSLYGWMRRSFLEPLRIPEERVVRLPGDAPDPEAACRAYDEAVRAAGGFDLAILGLGLNGHLGYNEPPTPPDAPAHVVALTAQSATGAAAYFGGQGATPRRAMTAGLGSLLAARRILLLVSGREKRAILSAALDGPETPDVPASYLRTAADVTVIADRAAWGKR